MAIATRLRNARHIRFSRIRHQKRLLAFLAATATRLTASATAQTSSIPSTVSAAAATSTLTNDGSQPADASTVVINGKTYTFQTSLTEADGHVKIGASNTASMTNLFHAINKSGGTAGTDYANAVVANADVTATNPSGTTVVITAKVSSSAANAFATTVGGTVHASWTGATMAGGVDVVFGNHVTATSHGISDGEGPYLLTSTLTLPASSPSISGVQLWVGVVDANTIGLARSRKQALARDFVVFSAAGTGTISLTKAVTTHGILDMLRTNKPATVVAATDVDNLR